MLVAVHDEILRRQISETLCHEGYPVEKETDSLEILSRLACKRRGRVDLLILDISCNRWVGQALLRATFCEDWALPVIVISDRDIDFREGADLWRAGVRAVWQRPLEIEVIRSSVAAACRAAGAEHV